MSNPVRSRLAITSLICALFFAAAFLSLFWIIDTAVAAPLDIPLSPSLPGNLDHLNITGTKTASPELAVNAGGECGKRLLAWVAVGRMSQERYLFGVSIPRSDLSWSQSGVPSLTQHMSTGFFHTLLARC